MADPFRLLARKSGTVAADSFELALDDGRTIAVRRVRDARAKRIKLVVDDRGARLTLPIRASAAAGERFAAEHRGWLATQIERHVAARHPPLQPFSTSSLPLRGAELPVRWQAGRFCRVQRDGDGIVFELSARAGAPARVRALREFYEAQARVDVGRWLPPQLATLPRAPRRFRLKPMRSQWGSLAPDGTVALDLALVLGRESAFEYVLIHELCHLLRRDHSAAFWREVEARCPGWRHEREYFRAEGRQLKSRLAALLDPMETAG